MEKSGQKRSKFQNIKEKFNVGGKLMESFSDEFKELMESLREVDDTIRAIATGEGSNDSGQTLKDLLKVARTNFNRREYMTAISFLGRFHDRLEEIYTALSKLDNTVALKHHDFLFKDVDSEHIDYLTKKLKTKFDKKKKTNAPGILTNASLDKEAGIVDWWHNLRDDRGKTLSAWEKRFPKHAKELKNQTNNILSKAENLLAFTLSTFKTLSSLRNDRKLEEYLKTANKWSEKYKSFNSMFASYYNSYVKKFVDYQDSLMGQEDEENEDEKIDIDTDIDESEIEGISQQELAKLLVNPLIQKSLKKNKDVVTEQSTIKQPEKNKLIPKEPSEEDVIQLNKLQPGTVAYIKKYIDIYGKIPPVLTPKPIDREKLNKAIEMHKAEEAAKKSQSPTEIIPDTIKDPTENLSNESIFGELPSVKSPAEKPTTESVFKFLPKPSSHDTLTDIREKMDLANPIIPKAPLTPKEMRETISAKNTVFLAKLSMMKNESPLVMAKEIITYANSIKKIDPQSSDKLLVIAKNILK